MNRMVKICHCISLACLISCSLNAHNEKTHVALGASVTAQAPQAAVEAIKQVEATFNQKVQMSEEKYMQAIKPAQDIMEKEINQAAQEYEHALKGIQAKYSTSTSSTQE